MCISVIDVNMPLSQHICTTCCIGFQLHSVSHIGYWCWSGGAFSVVPGHTYVSSVVRYLMYPTIEPFILLLPANFWFLVLQLWLCSIAHSPLSAPPPGMDCHWGCVYCLGKTQTMCSASWLRLIYIEVAGLVDFLKGRFTNSWMNELTHLFAKA